MIAHEELCEKRGEPPASRFFGAMVAAMRSTVVEHVAKGSELARLEKTQPELRALVENGKVNTESTPSSQADVCRSSHILKDINMMRVCAPCAPHDARVRGVCAA